MPASLRISGELCKADVTKALCVALIFNTLTQKRRREKLIKLKTWGVIRKNFVPLQPKKKTVTHYLKK
jgi:hypothetical protein